MTFFFFLNETAVLHHDTGVLEQEFSHTHTFSTSTLPHDIKGRASSRSASHPIYHIPPLPLGNLSYLDISALCHTSKYHIVRASFRPAYCSVPYVVSQVAHHTWVNFQTSISPHRIIVRASFRPAFRSLLVGGYDTSRLDIIPPPPPGVNYLYLHVSAVSWGPVSARRPVP